MHDSLKKTLEKKLKRVNKFTEKERFLIGKYTAINGPGVTVRKFRKSHPYLKFGESKSICQKIPGSREKGAKCR